MISCIADTHAKFCWGVACTRLQSSRVRAAGKSASVTAPNGTAQAQLVLPNTPSLAGATFSSQMLPLEIDAALNIIEVTSTNVIGVTVGSF